jgi:Ca2+-binding RTX toxin-like protein
LSIFEDIYDYLFDYTTAIIDIVKPPTPPNFILEPTATVIPPLASGSLLFIGHEGLVFGLLGSAPESSGNYVFVEGGVIGHIGLGGHASSSHHVEVGASGFVRGVGAAVGIGGGGSTVINEGSILGGHGVTLVGSHGAKVVNTGSIVAEYFGVLLDGDSMPDRPNETRISNSGTIDGATGIELLHATAVVTNLGSIVGRGPRIGGSRLGGHAIDGAEANAGLVVNNAGSLIGQDVALVGSAFADKVVNSGFISGDVVLGKGRDAYSGQGTVDGVVKGAKGDDTLFGGSGDDTLDGGGQDDRLRGSKGDDLLSGGSGSDQFIFRLGDGHDTVADFANDIDSLDLTSLHFNDFAEVGALAREITGSIVSGVLLTLAGYGNGTIFLTDMTMAQFDIGDVVI